MLCDPRVLCPCAVPEVHSGAAVERRALPSAAPLRRRPARFGLGLLAAALLRAAPSLALGVEPPAPAALFQAVGQLSAVDGDTGQLTVVTDAGATLQVVVGAGTTLLRLAPGQTSLQGASALRVADLAKGDRVLVRGGTPLAGRVDGPRQVLVMARADLVAQEEQQQRAWRERGLSGTVTAVEPTLGQVLLRPAGLRLREPIVIELARATLRRYAEQSARFADARPATLAEVTVGDPMRVLGQRSPDGTRYVAEQAVFGAFRSLAAAVESVDVDTRSLVVKDLEKRTRLVLVLAPDASLRRLPPELAALSSAGASPRGSGQRPSERGAGGPGRAPEELAERLPTMPLSALRKGDWIGAVVAPAAVDGRTLAFNLLAGIEALATRSETPGAPVQVGLPAGVLDSALGVQ